MEIEEAEACRLEEDVIDTSVRLKNLSTDDNVRTGVVTRSQRKKRRLDQEHGVDKHSTKSTQTTGHVFVGKQKELIITTNYFLVKLVFDGQAVQKLIDTTVTDVDLITDTIMTSLARLEWNGEHILKQAMTSFRLRLSRDLMPQLLKEVAQLIVAEPDQHRLQLLAQELLEKHLVRLFGLDQGSLVFILHHSSIDDARDTLRLRRRQRALQSVLLSFLPEWVAPLAQWTVTAYRLTPEDEAENFAFANSREVPFISKVSEGSKEDSNPGPAVSVSQSPQAQPLPSKAGAKRSLTPVRKVDTKLSSKSSGASHGAVEGGVEVSRSVGDSPRPKADRQDEGREEAEPTASTSRVSPSYVSEELQSYLPSADTAAEGAVKEPVMRMEGEPSTSKPFQLPSKERLLHLQDIDTDDIPKHDVDLRLVIVGKTGSGKSSVANSILGTDLFTVGSGFSAVTSQCQLVSTIREGTVIEVMDSPGLFDTRLTTQQVSSIIMSAVARMEDGPDAVLYVLRIGAKYTDEEFAAYNLLKTLLDEKVTQHLIVVFTYGDLLKGQTIQPMLDAPKILATMMRECGHRYVVFDNMAEDKRTQVNELLKQVRQLKARNQGRRYRCPRYAEKLDEIDQELEAQLIKAQQESLKDNSYVRFLQVQLSQAQRQLIEEKQRLASLTQARKEVSRKLKEEAEEEQRRMKEALKRGEKLEEEGLLQLRALQERLAKEAAKSTAKRTATDTAQRTTEDATHPTTEQIAMGSREEQMRQHMERLEAEKREAEREAEGGYMREMAKLRMEVARSRRRRRNDCSVM